MYTLPLEFMYDTAVGPFVYAPHDEFMGRSIKLYGEYSPSEGRLLASLLPSTHGVMFDIGANIGWITRAINQYKSKTTVYAFEPMPITADILHMNLGLAGDPDHLHAYQWAVGATDTTVKIPIYDFRKTANYGAMSSAQWTGEGIPIPQYTIDTIKAMLGVGRIDLIKIDVEGMERDVLEGGVNTIRRQTPTLFVENDKPDKGRALIEYLHSIDYRCWWFVNPLFEQPNWADNPTNEFGTQASFNMICIHKDKPTPEIVESLRRVSPSDPIGVCVNSDINIVDPI